MEGNDRHLKRTAQRLDRPIPSSSSYPHTTTTARLYPPSAYYCANLTLELLLNAGNGCVYALISYYMLNYQAYVQAPNPALSAFGFIGLVTLTNVVANVRTSHGLNRLPTESRVHYLTESGRVPTSQPDHHRTITSSLLHPKPQPNRPRSSSSPSPRPTSRSPSFPLRGSPRSRRSWPVPRFGT